MLNHQLFRANRLLTLNMPRFCDLLSELRAESPPQNSSMLPPKAEHLRWELGRVKTTGASPSKSAISANPNQATGVASPFLFRVLESFRL